jgi:hypothetical protein
MKKMKLVLENLQVESFAVDPSIDGMGTVAGHAESYSQCYTYCGAGCELSFTCPSAGETQCAGDSCTLCPGPGGCGIYDSSWEC